MVKLYSIVPMHKIPLWTTNGTTTIHRGCEAKSRCEELQATATINQTLDFCGLCDSALCNRGFTLNHFTSVIVSAITFVLCKLY
ncbi:hypothetical protein NQ317_006609 [Molorchus minor]|uniref:Protein quiver n=1 Tax=Molorchus minor TaxID=1323400 RepID=A0ABQ9K080_9CUCU|nr:hypothetical protein NQ317_006609 [Molorchus minor]